MAAALRLRSGPLRASVRQRRNAGCNRMEARLPFRSSRMQNNASRFLCRPSEAISIQSAEGSWVRTLLSGAGGIGFALRIAQEMGPAGIPQWKDRNRGRLREESAERLRLSLRDESVAGKPAASGSTNRAAKHYGFSEVEESHVGIQPRHSAAGNCGCRK